MEQNTVEIPEMTMQTIYYHRDYQEGNITVFDIEWKNGRLEGLYYDDDHRLHALVQIPGEMVWRVKQYG